MGTATLEATWQPHLVDHLDEWAGSFTLGGEPLGAFIGAVEVASPLGDAIWGEPVAATPGGDGWGTAVEMLDDEFHPQWNAVAEALGALEGVWLHPETRWSVDPYAVARGSSMIYLGCVDRNDPHSGRPRFDPTVDPLSNDLGVIAFPVRTAMVLTLAEHGATDDELGVAAVIGAVIEAGLHEAFELHQVRPGEPVLDPHRTEWGTVTAQLTLRTGRRVTLQPAS